MAANRRATLSTQSLLPKRLTTEDTEARRSLSESTTEAPRHRDLGCVRRGPACPAGRLVRHDNRQMNDVEAKSSFICRLSRLIRRFAAPRRTPLWLCDSVVHNPLRALRAPR